VLELLPAIDPTVVLQMTPPPGDPFPAPGVNPLSQLIGSAVSAFLAVLVVGAILVAVAEPYTEARMGDVLEDPVGSFLYGVALLLAIVVLAFLLVLTFFGIIVAIPLVLAAYLVWAVGAAIAFLAIADRLVGHDDGWLQPLLVGAAINGGLALTGVGGIISFAVGAAGFGAVLQEQFR
jgi:hypothetical protein